MPGELAQTLPTEAPVRRRGNFGPRDKKSRFVKRPRLVWVEGKTVKGILEDMQLVYQQSSNKDSGAGQKWWRKLLRDDPLKFLETLRKEEKRQLGYDEAAAEQAEELEEANKRVSELKAKVAELEKSLQEERAKMTAKLLEETRNVCNYRAVKMVEKLIEDFRVKSESERQQAVKAGRCVVCGQKPSPKASEPERIVAEQVDRSIPESYQANEPVNMTDEDRPKWRAYVAKIQRNQRPLNITTDEIGLCRKYGSPIHYIKGRKN